MTQTLDAIPGFTFARELGCGAFGRVVLAREEGGLERLVALKLFPAERFEAYQRELGVLRQVEELRRRSRLAVVPALATGEHEGWGWIALEYMEQGTLADRVREQGPLPLDEALRYARALGEILAQLHAGGIVHRDVKPANVLVDFEGQVWLGDFGLGERASAQASRGGSPGFVAPEVLRGDLVDGERADVYSLGATLGYLLSGECFLPGEPDVFALEREGVPREVQDAILDAAAADPAERTPSAEAFLEALRPPAQPSRRRRWLLLLLLLQLLTPALWFGREPLELAYSEWQARRAIRAIQAAQERFRATDAEGDGIHDYGTLDELRAAGLLEGPLPAGYRFWSEPPDLISDGLNPDYLDADGNGCMSTHVNARAEDAQRTYGVVAFPAVPQVSGRRVFFASPEGLQALLPNYAFPQVLSRVESGSLATGLFAGSGIEKWEDSDPVSPGSLQALAGRYPQWAAYEDLGR